MREIDFQHYHDIMKWNHFSFFYQSPYQFKCTQSEIYGVGNHLDRSSCTVSILYSNRALFGNLLLECKENGFISMFDTRRSWDHNFMLKKSCISSFRAHSNSVFDIQLNMDESRLLTGAGDATSGVFDFQTQQLIGKCIGHHGTVKSLAPSSISPYVHATASRDGSIMVWDARVSTQDGCIASVIQFISAHGDKLGKSAAIRLPNRSESLAEISPVYQEIYEKMISKKPKMMIQENLGVSEMFKKSVSITGVRFLQSEFLLASSCMANSTIFIHDLRKISSAPITILLPFENKRGRDFGVTHIALDPSLTLLSVACKDQKVYIYDTSSISSHPVMTCTGYLNSSFFIKCDFNAHDQLSCGGSDGKVTVWDVSRSNWNRNCEIEPSFQFESGMGFEVNRLKTEIGSAIWCPADPLKLAGCGDDLTIRLYHCIR